MSSLPESCAGSARVAEARVPRVVAAVRRCGAAFALALVPFAVGCYGPSSEQLSCDDVLPAGSVDFATLQSLVLRPPRGKGCLEASCHSASSQSAGIRLDDPELIYEELSTRPDLFYAVLASGEMPQRGRPWGPADLRAFRSWYCSGAFAP
jgi:hypothetical protein